MPSPVEFIRKDVEEMLPQWKRIRAACHGQHAVKALKEQALPRPTFGDTSVEAQSRYEAYLLRAVYYNVSGRTLEAMAGYVFTKEPTVKLPADIAILEENIDGAGVTLEQQAKAALREVLGLGRCGLLADYPSLPEGKVATKEDVNKGLIAPTIVLYLPEDIINWKTKTVGAKLFITKLVLRETYVDESANEFEVKACVQYRVLDLEDGKGVVGRIFRQITDGGEFEERPDLSYLAKNKSGAPLTEIPFTFLGAVNNDASIDQPPLQDLVNLNLAHFINSADHEESCFLCGQPTPWASGLTKQWVEEVMLGKITLGSRAVIPLPEHGACGMLQANPNTLPKEAMEHKERQMVAIGAKLVQEKKVQRTATEAGLEHSAEVSVLEAAALNVFDGYVRAIKYACQFVGTGDETVEFELSEPLGEDTIDGQTATSLVGAWTAQLISFTEARQVLRKPGWASLDDDKARAEIEAAGMPPGGVVPGGALDPNAGAAGDSAPPGASKRPTTPLQAQ